MRAAALAPLVLFVMYAAHAAAEGRAAESLWICHLANLLLAFGMVADCPAAARAAVLLMIPGLPLWIYDMVVSSAVDPVSVLSHLGGLAIGIAVLLRQKPYRRSWHWALLAYFCAQAAARAFTPAELNVNVAHAPYPGFEKVFPGYAAYWLFTSLAAFVVLWAADRMMLGLLRPAAAPARSLP